MTVAQELTRMTPEVNHALLSAEGELWKGEWGAPHRKAKKPKRFEFNKSTGLSANRFTANQRTMINYLRENGKTEARVITKKTGIKTIEVARSLVKAGLVQEFKGRYVVFKLTKKGQTVQLLKTLGEEAIEFMKNIGQFRTPDIASHVGTASAGKAVTKMLQEGRIVMMPEEFPPKYRWVK